MRKYVNGVAIVWKWNESDAYLGFIELQGIGYLDASCSR